MNQDSGNKEKNSAIPTSELQKSNELDAAQPFTPGPWRWVEIPSGGLAIKARLPHVPHSAEPNREYSFWRIPKLTANFQATESGELWAHFSFEEWAQFPSPNFEEMQKANARLIAAAPALYEALKATPCLKADFEGDTCQWWADNYDQELCQRCAALALATDNAPAQDLGHNNDRKQ